MYCPMSISIPRKHTSMFDRAARSMSSPICIVLFMPARKRNKKNSSNKVVLRDELAR